MPAPAVETKLKRDVFNTTPERPYRLTEGLEDFFRKIAQYPDKDRATVQKILKGKKDNPEKAEDRIKVTEDKRTKTFTVEIPPTRKDLELDTIRAVHVVKDGQVLTSLSKLKDGKGIFAQIYKDGRPLITPDCELVIEKNSGGLAGKLLRGYYARTEVPGIGRALGALPEISVLRGLCVGNRHLSIQEGIDNATTP